MKRFALILLVGLFCANAQAQTQILYQANETKSWLLTYMQSSGEESQRVLNEMLEAIATFVPKPVTQTKIMFNVNENIKITRDRNNVNIFVAHENITLSGDVFYKGFDMTDVIIPTKYDFSGILYRGNDVVLSSFTQPKTNFIAPYSEVMFKYIDTAQTSKYKFVVNSTMFYFDQTARNRFRDKVILIDQYYQAETDLKNILTQMNAIDPDAFEAINSTQEYMSTIKKNLDNISGAAFWQALHVEGFDPAHVYTRLYEANSRHKDLQTRVNYTLSVIHQLYYDKALKAYNAGKKSDAKSNFEKSLSYSPMYGPSQYYLVRIAFDDKNYTEAKQQMKKLFSFKSLDEQIRLSALELCRALEWTDMNTAAGLLNEGKFNEALTAVQKAEDFCKGIPMYSCNDTIELIRKDCHNGNYAQYVQTGEQLFVQKKINEAEISADQAVDYQKRYSNYIPDNKAALTLKEKVKVEQYIVAVKSGKDYMKLKDYRNAFEQFSLATQTESNYTVKRDAQLPELLIASKLEVMLLDLADAEKAVAGNNLNGAREILKEVMADQKLYGLLSDARLNTKIESLKKSIFSQECENAQKLYDTQISAANQSVATKDFISAEAQFEEAYQTSNKNKDCSINTTLATEGKKSMGDPAAYQRNYNQCRSDISSTLYEKAISGYNKLGEFYTAKSLSTYGIIHMPLHEFMCTQRYEFPLYGVTYMVGTNQLEYGYYLLQHLRKVGANPKVTKNQQASLARAIALRDYKADPAVNAKLKVAEYTLGDKWYGTFKKEYLKQIKGIK